MVLTVVDLIAMVVIGCSLIASAVYAMIAFLKLVVSTDFSGRFFGLADHHTEEDEVGPGQHYRPVIQRILGPRFLICMAPMTWRVTSARLTFLSRHPTHFEPL